jgi:hypothetical protein
MVSPVEISALRHSKSRSQYSDAYPLVLGKSSQDGINVFRNDRNHLNFYP